VVPSGECLRRKSRHGVLADKTVWSMLECFEIYIVYKMALYKYSSFHFLSFWSYSNGQKILTKCRKAGQIFHGDNLMWHWRVGSIAVGCSSRAIMPLLRNEWWSFCCIHCSRSTQRFSMCQTTPKLPIPVRDVHLI